MPHLSVVIPVYKAESCLFELYSRLKGALETISPDFEIILVEDCGGDRSWAIIVELAERDSRVKGLKFSRNFGQHCGITAGLDHCDGDWVLVMDCDLQDLPEEIPKLYAAAGEGYDIVLARREQRQDSRVKRLSSTLFHFTLSYFTETKSDPAIANFGMYSRKVIDSVRQMREKDRAFPFLVRWLGFSVAEVEVTHAPRFAGTTSYTLRKLVDLAIDIIVSQSYKPLRLSIKFGFSVSFFSLVYGSWLIIRRLVWTIPVEGWTSVMVSIYFIGGLLFANMGFLGVYVGKIYDQSKGRPLYVISKKIGL